MPALLSWPGHIPGGQVIGEIGAAMDVFPTFLKLAGVAVDTYDVDGCDLWEMVTEQAVSPHAEIFWEMEEQTAVRRGPWKLVLDGRLVEGAPVEDEVHLANLDADMSERTNLAAEQPELVAELRAAAEMWPRASRRAGRRNMRRA